MSIRLIGVTVALLLLGACSVTVGSCRGYGCAGTTYRTQMPAISNLLYEQRSKRPVIRDGKFWIVVKFPPRAQMGRCDSVELALFRPGRNRPRHIVVPYEGNELQYVLVPAVGGLRVKSLYYWGGSRYGRVTNGAQTLTYGAAHLATPPYSLALPEPQRGCT